MTVTIMRKRKWGATGSAFFFLLFFLLLCSPPHPLTYRAISRQPSSPPTLPIAHHGRGDSALELLSYHLSCLVDQALTAHDNDGMSLLLSFPTLYCTAPLSARARTTSATHCGSSPPAMEATDSSHALAWARTVHNRGASSRRHWLLGPPG
ncbi:hypothetical protein B0J18DRAFT_174825 [Chaetomium sp. MPI-SDFR-AT-0129]|nr:hypothetical protein B0J18DRAFT_174825 [Chaetomium sp. MPI-SDFR-AT-0129]